MIVRALDANGDYQLGVFLSNSREAVGQAVQTKLALWEGEWFLDQTEGTPYMQDILGKDTNYDIEIQTRILAAPGVSSIAAYSSSVIDRGLSVDATIDTIYGQANVSTP